MVGGINLYAHHRVRLTWSDGLNRAELMVIASEWRILVNCPLTNITKDSIIGMKPNAIGSLLFHTSQLSDPRRQRWGIPQRADQFMSLLRHLWQDRSVAYSRFISRAISVKEPR